MNTENRLWKLSVRSKRDQHHVEAAHAGVRRMSGGFRHRAHMSRLAALGIVCLAVGCTAQRPQTVETARTVDKPDVFALKMKCAEFGKRYADDLAKAGERLGNSPADPRFAYNLELNTCVVRAGYLNHGKLYVFIADSLTGETLFDMSGNDPSKQSEFNQAETRLMGPSESDLAGKLIKSPQTLPDQK